MSHTESLPTVWLTFQIKKDFFEIVKDATSDNFKCSLEKVLSHLSQGARNLEPGHVRSLFFGDFANPDSNLKNYDEITDEVGLKTTMDSYLEEYNQMSTAPMSLANRVLDTYFCVGSS